MKTISKNKMQKRGTLFLFTLLIAIPFSCKKMDNLNVDEKALPYGPYVPAALIQSMEYNIVKINPEWQYQLQQSLNADCYSQYMCPPTPFAGNQNNVTYFWMDGWNGFITSILYDNVMNPWLDVKAATKAKNTNEDLYSISLIIKVMAASRVTDIFGPLPYTKHGQGTNVAWDSQQTIYNAFFDELKTAIDQLTTVENATPNLDAKWATFDKSNLAGDYKKWVQVANTLRLRLAIRISKADPSKAKAEAEAAASHPFGLLESMPFLIQTAYNHPIATISGGWNDILLGAPMGSLLSGYNDPRLAKYALPATDPLVAGQFIGIRQGIDIAAKATYVGFSQLNIKATDPVQLMSKSESYFLRAEGALNGWNMNGGSAQTYYEKGVDASFTEHGLTGAAAYLTDGANNQAKAYVDPHNPANNVPLGDPNLSTISKQWGGTAAEQLEKIITQKWIALFPDGIEAWSEFRRTGYPKLWPVIKNFSGGDIPAGEFVKRLPYPSSLTTTAPQQYAAALTLLGGADKGNTKLWWNK